jgi:hypothetical protein
MKVPYAELALRARQEVTTLEEPFKSVAYGIILKDLIEESKKGISEKSRVEAPITSPDELEDPVEKFMSSKVEPGEYGELFAGRGQIVEKSLAVLKLARDTLAIDGLTASQITDILIRKFRVSKVYRPNVSNALRSATAYVHRVQTHGDYKYLLMIAGENHLKEVVSGKR